MRNFTGQIKSLILIALIIILPGCGLYCDFEDENKIVDLSGKWKFSIGDNERWSEVSYDHRGWDEISVPGAWEDNGFHGYNGYAWYRKDFQISSHFKNKSIYLHLGYVDDVNAVYLNGHLIGITGTFPPEYRTAYNAYRKYYIPERYLNFDGENIIAVRVYDAELAGGIVHGKIGLYSEGDVVQADISLEGDWSFTTGDSTAFSSPDFDHSHWRSIIVPGVWETQGFPDYDGFAWYRKKVFIPETFKDESFVLVMGKIDDIDEVYLNGTMIGSSGNMNTEPIEFNRFNEWASLRGYFIPAGLIQYGKENTIAVRVYDGYLNGGIYEGPVGFVRQKIYRDYWHNKR